MNPNFSKLLFNISIPHPKPAIGRLLVAEPFMHDENFRHSVICLVDYEESGKAMGVVLNHRMNYTLDQLMEDVEREDIEVYCGGPMSMDRLFFIHTLGDIIPGARQIGENLYIGGDFEAMTDYVNSGYPLEGKIRFFVGYSGWGDHQLDDELEANVWGVALLSDAEEMLTGEDDSYWHRTVKGMGETYRGWLFHPQNIHSN